MKWGMNKNEVKKVLGGVSPDKTSKRLDSYRSRFYGRSSIQNFVYLDGGLGAVIYLLPLLETDKGPVVFEELESKLRMELGSPNNVDRQPGQEWRTYWSSERGEILLVWNSKKSRSNSLKVLFLSMPWIELQQQLGHMP